MTAGLSGSTVWPLARAPSRLVSEGEVAILVRVGVRVPTPSFFLIARTLSANWVRPCSEVMWGMSLSHKSSTSAASYAFLNSAYGALRLKSNGTNWNPW